MLLSTTINQVWHFDVLVSSCFTHKFRFVVDEWLLFIIIAKQIRDLYKQLKAEKRDDFKAYPQCLVCGWHMCFLLLCCTASSIIQMTIFCVWYVDAKILKGRYLCGLDIKIDIY